MLNILWFLFGPPSTEFEKRLERDKVKAMYSLLGRSTL